MYPTWMNNPQVEFTVSKRTNVVVLLRQALRERLPHVGVQLTTIRTSLTAGCVQFYIIKSATAVLNSNSLSRDTVVVKSAYMNGCEVHHGVELEPLKDEVYHRAHHIRSWGGQPVLNHHLQRSGCHAV